MKDQLTPQARKVVYRVLGVLGLVLGSTQVAYASAEAGQPVWLTVSLGVFAYVAAAVGYTAQGNVDTPTQYEVPEGAGEGEREV